MIKIKKTVNKLTNKQTNNQINIFLDPEYISQIKSDLHEILRVSDRNLRLPNGGPKGPHLVAKGHQPSTGAGSLAPVGGLCKFPRRVCPCVQQLSDFRKFAYLYIKNLTKLSSHIFDL